MASAEDYPPSETLFLGHVMTTGNSTVVSRLNVKSLRWQAFWDGLTRPTAAIHDPDDRHKAQMLSAMLLLLAIIFAVISFFSEPVVALRAGQNIWSVPLFYIDISYFIGLLVAYGVSRARYLLGGYIALAVSFISLYSTVIFLPDFVHYETVIVYVIVQYTIASFFLGIRKMIVLAVTYLVITSLVALLVPHVALIEFLTPMPFIVMMLSLSLIFVRYRDSQEKARQDQMARTLERNELLRETAQVISSTIEFEDVLARIAEQMCRAIDATSAYICDWQDGVLQATVIAEYFGPAACDLERVSDLGTTYDDREYLDQEFMAAMRQGHAETAHIDDPKLSVLDRQHMSQYGARTILYIPLRVQGQLIGYIELWESRRQREFTPGEIALCQSIAQQAAFALENAQLHRRLQTHAANLEQRVEQRTAELEETNQQLRLASAVKDEFVANVSHEFRTPLTNIKLYLNLMRLKPEDSQHYVGIVSREAERLRCLVEDVLFLSELDRQEAPPDVSPCDLNTLAETFVADRIALATERNLSLEFIPTIGLPMALIHRSGFEYALSNLVTNALNYTPAGGRVIVSTRQCLNDEGTLRVGLSVQDTGPGIDPDEAARLFERFFRGKQALLTGTPGTGLGLSIVKDIVERHGGEVEVGRNPDNGHGASFTVWLPAAPMSETVELAE